MVPEVGAQGSGQMKRSSPLDGLRFPHYASSYMDGVGHVQEKNQVFFTPEIRERFRKLVGAEEDSTVLVPLEIGDEGKIRAYYKTALKHIHQDNCLTDEIFRVRQIEERFKRQEVGK
jgi:hypothetical protein